jgi:O-antigen/teichoic acid export membrane protein
VTAEESLTPAVPAITPNPTAGMTTKVVKGSLWTLAGQVAPLAVSLITTPFVIRMLGAESYGIFILITLIPSYLGFADFGMGLASTKYASEAYGDGDLVREARIVRTAALIALTSSVPIALILFLFSSPIIGLFSVPDQMHGDASLALKLSAITFVINFLTNIFNTPQLTRLRMDLNTLVTAGFRVFGLILTPFAVYHSGILGAVTVLLISSILTLLGHLFFSQRLDRHLFELTIDRKIVRPLIKFGGALVGASIAAVLLVNAEKGILAANVSAAALAHYSVAFTLANMMALFSTAMVQSLVPAFSQLQSEENRAHLNSLYSRGIRLSLIWLVPALGFIAITGRVFFMYWAGKEFADESTLPLYILLVGIAFNVLAYFPAAVLISSGRADLFAKLYWAELIVYVALVWVLSSRLGAVGAAIAWSLRVTADAIIMFYLASRISRVEYQQRSKLPFAIAITVMLIPVIITLAVGQAGLLVFMIEAMCLLFYAVFVYKGMLETEEISWLSNWIGRRFARTIP